MHAGSGSTDEVITLCSYHICCVDCPYEGQVVMNCVPLCPTICTNTTSVTSSCPRACIRGVAVQIEW